MMINSMSIYGLGTYISHYKHIYRMIYPHIYPIYYIGNKNWDPYDHHFFWMLGLTDCVGQNSKVTSDSRCIYYMYIYKFKDHPAASIQVMFGVSDNV